MKKVIAMMLTAAMAASVVGCGGGTNASSQAESAGTEAVLASAESGKEQAQGEKEEGSLRKNEIVRVGFPAAVASFLWTPFIVSQQMGYFDDEGIDVVFEQSYSSSATRMVASNQAEFSAPGPHLTAAGIESGMDIVSVFQLYPVDIFGFAVMADSGMTSVKDLEGKTIGTMTPTTANQVIPILEAAGVNPESVTMIPISDARAQQLQEKTVDAVWTWDGEWQQWKAEGMDIAYLSGEEVYKSSSNSIIANTNLVKEYPDLINGFNRALAKGLYFCYCNPKAAADIVITSWPTLQVDLDSAEEIIDTAVNFMSGGKEVMEGTSIGEHRQEAIELLMGDYVKMGIVKTAIPDDKFYTNEFIEAANDWERSEVEQDAKDYEMVTK
ncbi:MAG: ABC transporter substrate-binding protein [Lachnoclostridium edouardi]|uniref:ABC transporter substrate-binding protein n=1 Tax=Lachnoclostridium edouardi TaxID=1926283 RepID=UPI0026DD5923|nr:ABC transporter substrate-binding protein [Lachnoclostridium edouardi]MDO4278493.1 ABC transporter substrate-binding protein [Lachnoclostridium edouardi]